MWATDTNACFSQHSQNIQTQLLSNLGLDTHCTDKMHTQVSTS